MPCRLNGDVHEWFNEVVTVPNQNLPKILSGENATNAQWEAETLWNFTAACCCDLIENAEYRQERRDAFSGTRGAQL